MQPHLWIGEVMEYSQIICGILRPLANPETLKNLPMCNFEKTAYGNGHFFKIIWKNTPNTHPNTPRRGRRGVRGWVFGVFVQMILKKCPFFNNHWKYAHPCFSKLHIGRFFKVSGFPKGRRMPVHKQVNIVQVSPNINLTILGEAGQGTFYLPDLG